MEGNGLAPNNAKHRLDLGMLFFMYFFICTYIYIIGNLQQHNGTGLVGLRYVIFYVFLYSYLCILHK